MLKNKNLYSTLLLLIGLIACNAFAKSYSEEELGLRKSNLFEEKHTIKDSIAYLEDIPGESKVIKRSFENAPPLISHNVDGMLPITPENNMCLGCHEPIMAKEIGVISAPKSHLASYRPTTNIVNGVVKKDGKDYENTSDIEISIHKRNSVSADRFNCSQCHVPQTDNEPLVKNEFNPEFRNANDEFQSNLADILDEGVSYKKLK